MSIYHSENLPEADNLVELTREELYWSTDIEDEQKIYLFRALDFTEKMGLRLFLCPDFPCLYVSDGEIFSEILGVEPPELCILLFLLEFMFTRYGGVTEEETSNKIAQLEQRIGVLEKALSVDGASTESDLTPDSRKQKLEELMARAHAIGTRIEEYREGGYSYVRPRFLIPGSNYKFYYCVDNAYDTRRKRILTYYYQFASYELDELERWVANDEKIFAECNRQYSVK